MESNQSYELVGGVARVVMHPASTPLPEIGECGETSVEIPLDVGVASYIERQELVSGQYRVLHKLSFQFEHGESPFTKELTSQLLTKGAIADVTLGTGATIRVGWSSRYEASAPLRLQNMEFTSGERKVDYPLKSWVWCSTDYQTLI